MAEWERGNQEEDRQARQILEPLKGICPPVRLRDHCREAIAEAISEQPTTPPPLWRRRVSIPLPLAAAALLVVAILTALQIVQLNKAELPIVRKPPDENRVASEDPAVLAAAEQPVAFQRALYLPGQGVLVRESGYKIPAHFQPPKEGAK